jgi:hypothetical protein
MPRIVDADSNRNDRNVNISERIEQGNAVAEILKSLPWFIWAVPCWLLAGLILLAIGHEGLNGFTSSVMGWLSLVPWVAGVVSAVRAFTWIHNTYNKVRVDAYNRRLLSANARKAQEGVLTVQYKNESLLADVDIRKQIPGLLAHLATNGVPFEYTAKGDLKVLGVSGVRVTPEMVNQGQIGAGAPLALGPGGMVGGLPTQVLYENVRGQVPAGRFLVGVGAAGIDTIEVKRGGACVWIVGLSGTGKSSTAVIRVEERASVGHKFMGVDPHWFKDDSLYHSIYETVDQETGAVSPGAYKHLFVMPIARNPEEAKAVLQAFLDEFYGRRGGKIPKPWQKITLLVDELGALVDATSDEEEEVKAMLKTITRICGQEARNFEMGGIFISQQATELAWLRKVALMVIVHQLMQESEKKLATNDDKAVMLDMKTWPVGRTYVYGVGFGQEGPRTVQQPYFAGRRFNSAAGGDDPALDRGNDAEIVDVEQLEEDSNPYPDESNQGQTEHHTEDLAPITPALSGDLRAVYDACQVILQSRQAISARSVAELIPEMKKDKANGLLNRLEDLGYIQRRKAI